MFSQDIVLKNEKVEKVNIGDTVRKPKSHSTKSVKTHLMASFKGNDLAAINTKDRRNINDMSTNSSDTIKNK